MFTIGENSLLNDINYKDIDFILYCKGEGLNFFEVKRDVTLNKKRVTFIDLIKRIFK